MLVLFQEDNLPSMSWRLAIISETFPGLDGHIRVVTVKTRPPLWSSGQSFWLQIQWSRVRFPALPDFLSSSGSGTGSTQPREVN